MDHWRWMLISVFLTQVITVSLTFCHSVFDIKGTISHNTYFNFFPSLRSTVHTLHQKYLFMKNYYPPCSLFSLELNGPCCCALKKHHVKFKYEPCRIRFIFHVLYLFIGMITKAVLKSSEEEKKEEEVKKTLEQHDSIVTQYKELIREQVKINQTISHSLILSQCNVSN